MAILPIAFGNELNNFALPCYDYIQLSLKLILYSFQVKTQMQNGFLVELRMCACNLSCKNAQHNRTRAYPGWQRLDLEHPAWHVDSKLMEKLNGNEITNLLPDCWSVSVSVRGCMHALSIGDENKFEHFLFGTRIDIRSVCISKTIEMVNGPLCQFICYCSQCLFFISSLIIRGIFCFKAVIIFDMRISTDIDSNIIGAAVVVHRCCHSKLFRGKKMCV